MVNEFKLTVVHFARPNPQDKNNYGKSGLDHRVSGPLAGRTAAALLLAKSR